jgi:3-isopropylmalate dehydrogenase
MDLRNGGEPAVTAQNAKRRIAIVGGDGIGPEVTAQGRRVLAWIADRRALPIELVDVEYGADAYKRFGEVLPTATFEAMRQADAILFGATGGPEFDAIPIQARRAGSLLVIRRGFDLYANLRPVKIMPALYEASSLKQRALEGLDMVIVRELTGGMYFGEPRGVETLPDGQRRGVNTHVYITSEIHRIARAAFELARKRRGHVCSVAKENVMEAGQLWREEVQALHDAEFRDVELTHMLADNCAMQIVRAPAQFDVIVTDNLFGDILSDCAAMATGSLGMLPSASLGPLKPDGRRAGLYEPVHGSAPDIAGKGLANPLGSVLSVAMMLRFSFDRDEDAALVEKAVSNALDGGARTADIACGGKYISTVEMGDAVLTELARLCE